MSMYLEIPEFDSGIPFRAFMNDGMTIVYPHWHKEIEMIYCKLGTVRIGVNDEIIPINEGEIYYFASGEPHYFLASPNSERYVYQFDLKLFDESLQHPEGKSLSHLLKDGERHSKNWPEELFVAVKQILLTTYEEEQDPQPASQFAIYAELYRMMTLFYRQLPQTAKPTKSGAKSEALKHKETLEQLDSVFLYVEEHYLETITLEEVANYVGFSPYYFTRFFKKHTGLTFMSFLTEYRIDQAKFILANERLPMADVAEQAGFTSVKTFHHVFKETVGISPLKYQKSISGNFLTEN